MCRDYLLDVSLLLLVSFSSCRPVLPAADGGDDLSKGYDYLLGMKIWNLTMERVKMMENELEAKTEEMAQLKVR